MKICGLLRLLLPLVLVVGGAWPVEAQARSSTTLPPFAWWRDARVQKDLVLTADQTARVDAVFQAALPQLRQKKTELDVQESELSRLIENDASEVSVARQSEHVEAIRADLNSTRTLMLVHMRQLLTLDQRTRFKIMRDTWAQQSRDRRSAAQRNTTK